MTNHLSDQQLIELMGTADDVDSTADDDAVLAHLDDCSDCQNRLASLSGEGDWLTELRQTLNGDSSALNLESHPPSSVSIILDGTHGENKTIDASRLKLDFLESPRHPELLGRLGRYDIERLVGVGGFGIVFKSHDTELHRIVALKVLSPHLMTSGAARKRFAREAQAAAAIHHENVTPIFDVVSEDAVAYLVMPYIAGSSLQERVDRDGPLSVDEVLRIGAQIAAGLAAAHKQAVIHRDVKPANILLESSLDRVLISDFGLARTADDASLTRSGVVTGTPHYMSPEQTVGDEMDARSDLFSLGSVLYFMCTGHPPFRAPQVLAVLHQISRKEPRPLDQVRKDIPFELQALISRLLKKQPSKRIASATEVCNELTRLLHAFRNGKLRQRSKWRSTVKSNLAAAVAIGLFCVCALAAASYWYDSNRHPTDVSQAPNRVQAATGNSNVILAEDQIDESESLSSEQFDVVATTLENSVRNLEETFMATHAFENVSDNAWNSIVNEIEQHLNQAESTYQQDSAQNGTPDRRQGL
jgi:serine/threonine protein kinase